MYNYSLSAYFARGQKERFEKGTWFLFANELFFILISLVMFIVTMLDFKLPNIILVILLLAVWSLSFYGIKNWLVNQVRVNNIAKEYSRNTANVFIGLLIFVGSFFMFLVVGTITFEGYLLRN